MSQWPGRLRVLGIDDEADDLELIRLALQGGGVDADVIPVWDEDGLRRALEPAPDLVLCDYSMPGFSAERAMAVLAERAPHLPLVVVTRAIGEEAVVGLFRAGAKDYVGKDKLGLLPGVVRRVLSERSMALERERAAQALASANTRLRLLSSHLVDAQERERTRIARELHDGLGQLLTGVVIQLQAAGNSQVPDQAERCRRWALELAEQGIRQVKTMSFQLRPPQFELLGFAAAVQATLDRQLEATCVQGGVRLRGVDPHVAGAAQVVALRVLQEALTNVLRHAGARRVLVRVRFVDANRFVLTLGDDGCGFDVKAALGEGLSERNLGLHGMLERAELMGGRLRFRSSPGRGTVVRLVSSADEAATPRWT